MQRNANVGSKLLALIAVPAVVLVAVASIGARDRLDEASRAQQTEDAAELASASTALVHELQIERLISARLTTGDAGAADGLATQREETDRAAEAFRVAGSGAEGTAIGQRFLGAVGQLDTIGELRASVDDQNAAPDVVVTTYTNGIRALLELDADLASRGGQPALAATLSDTLTLAAAKEARALRSAEVARIATVGEFDTGDFARLAELEAEEERQFVRLEESQDDELTTAVRNALATPAVREANALMDAVMDEGVIGGSGEPGVAPADWQEASIGWLDPVRGAEGTSLDATIASADQAAFEADKAARLFLIGTAAAVILSLLLASLLARRINRRLQRLTTAANDLATVELPRLVEDLRSPGDHPIATEPLTPIEVDSGDEIGQLAEAFNAIQAVTSQVAEEQAALLRRGIADIFVNLARRNQSLLDRQIEFIDELETHEQDPDQLENLFKLDHLATRMRRNAESLLVLAGAEPPRRRARPVELADVVRVAIGEVEDFTRINLLALDEITIGGNAAVDLAHLLSELMENATQFSPPDSAVEVVGNKGPDGSYTLTVSDRGIGMSAEQLADANALLAAPPPVGLALSRSLGFIVVGRLARRLQVGVRLTASPAGGITATVHLPAEVVAGQQIPPTGPIDGMPSGPQLVDEPRPLVVDEMAPRPVDAPATLADALPDGEDFDRGLAALVGPDVDPGTSDEDVHRSFWGELADGPTSGDPLDPPTPPSADAGPPAAMPPPPPAAMQPPPPAAMQPTPPAAMQPPPADPAAPQPMDEMSPTSFAPPAPDAAPWAAPTDQAGWPPAEETTASTDAAPWEPAPDWLDGELASVDTPPAAPVPPSAPAAPMAGSNGGAPAAPPLARRQPRATLADDGLRGGEPSTPRATSTRRSPEEVRAMLSRYRRGIHDGRNSEHEPREGGR